MWVLRVIVQNWYRLKIKYYEMGLKKYLNWYQPIFLSFFLELIEIVSIENLSVHCTKGILRYSIAFLHQYLSF